MWWRSSWLSSSLVPSSSTARRPTVCYVVCIYHVQLGAVLTVTSLRISVDDGGHNALICAPCSCSARWRAWRLGAAVTSRRHCAPHVPRPWARVQQTPRCSPAATSAAGNAAPPQDRPELVGYIGNAAGNIMINDMMMSWWPLHHLCAILWAYYVLVRWRLLSALPEITHLRFFILCQLNFRSTFFPNLFLWDRCLGFDLSIFWFWMPSNTATEPLTLIGAA